RARPGGITPPRGGEKPRSTIHLIACSGARGCEGNKPCVESTSVSGRAVTWSAPKHRPSGYHCLATGLHTRPCSDRAETRSEPFTHRSAGVHGVHRGGCGRGRPGTPRTAPFGPFRVALALCGLFGLDRRGGFLRRPGGCVFGPSRGLGLSLGSLCSGGVGCRGLGLLGLLGLLGALCGIVLGRLAAQIGRASCRERGWSAVGAGRAQYG